MVLMGILCPGRLSERALAEFIPSPPGHRLSHVVCAMPVTLASISIAIHRSKYLVRKREAELLLISVGQ